mmetsp:Transcript_16332/g.30488  ORF Transcript_16332/g.30488 Transcript_16332/m.30488 type:complete len:1463 (-) Transcript_16332:187-4575(-)
MSKEEGTFNLTGLPDVQTPNNKPIPDGMRLDDYEFGGPSELKSPDKLSPVQVRKYFGDAARDRFNQRSNWLNKQRSLACQQPISNFRQLRQSFSESLGSAAEEAALAAGGKKKRKPKRLSQEILSKTDEEIIAGIDFSCLDTPRRAVSPEQLQVFDNIMDDDDADIFSVANRSLNSSHLKKRKDTSDTKDEIRKEFYDMDDRDRPQDGVTEDQSGRCVPTDSAFTSLDFDDDNVSQVSVDSDLMSSFEDPQLSRATQKFIKTLRAKTPNLAEVPRAGTGLNRPSSPRSKYIMKCLAGGVNPRASLILRKTLTKELYLQHYGMGDNMAVMLAESLAELPFINSINIADNNLTDAGMKPLLDAAMVMPKLTTLDMSDNVIGPDTADALAELLTKKPPTLERLLLRKADVDDFEGERFVTALIGNETIRELDLSNNLIGHAEILNTVMPDLLTATEAVAELLRTPTCHLETLKLAWNMIRLDSGIDLAKSLEINASLTYLDLRYNSLGHDGGQALGNSLMENRTLKTLLISNNNLDSTACFVLCIGIEQNLALKYVNMDENPIGEAGARSLMYVSTAVGSRLVLSAARCNTSLRDDAFWFNQERPCRSYNLDLSVNYDRAVAFKVLALVANHPTIIVNSASYQTSRNTKPEKLEFVQVQLTDKEAFLDDEQRTVLNNLYKLQECAKDIANVEKLFNDFDVDGSGEITRSEFTELLSNIGIQVTESQITDVMSVYDVDGGGTIELSEFLSFVRLQHVEAGSRIKDMIESQALVDVNHKNIRYQPPRSGFLNMQVFDSYSKKENFSVLTTTNRNVSSNVAEKMGDVSTLITYAFQNSKLRLSEAYRYYLTMYNDMGDKARVLSKLLPQMALSSEARMLVSKVTNDDQVMVARVKQTLGLAMRPIFGLANGFYSLNLTKPADRICFMKLLELSTTVNSKRMVLSKMGIGRIGDTSQKNNWSCFRNEFFNGNPIAITIDNFTPLPQVGKLEFDFSGALRPPFKQVHLSDNKLTKVLMNMTLIPPDGKDANLKRLKRYTRDSNFTSKGDGNMIYTPSDAMAVETGNVQYNFYENLRLREEAVTNAIRAEEIKVDFMKEYNDAIQAEKDAEAERIAEEERRIAEEAFKNRRKKKRESTAAEEENNTANTEEVKNVISAVPPVVEMETSSRPLTPASGRPTSPSDELDNMREDKDTKKNEKARNDQAESSRERLRQLLKSSKITDGAKAARILENLQDLLGDYWLLAKHLANIVAVFDVGKATHTELFGTYRVELVVSLFSRLIDVHNFDLVARELTGFEMGCIYCRLGWLNVFNSMKPEGSFELAMGRWEERQIAKIAVVLSVIEPGINFENVRFRWDKFVDPIPGWEVSQFWLTEDGMAKKGVFNYTFYSGEGKFLKGCEPHIPMRRAMLSMCLTEEWEVRKEGDLTEPNDPQFKVGETYMMTMQDKWKNYFYPAVTVFDANYAVTRKVP